MRITMTLQIKTENQLSAFIKEQLDGNNLSIRGTAGLAGVDEKSIRKALNSSADLKPSKLGQKLMQHGFECADLRENGFNAKALYLVLEYYAFESKARTLIALQLIRTFGQVGIQHVFEELNRVPETNQVPVVNNRSILEYEQAASRLDGIENLTLRSLLRDGIIEELSVKLGNKVLPASEPRKQYTIVTVRAKQLGYNPGTGSFLGKYVKNIIPVAYQEQVGRYPVNHYEINDELDRAIHAYYKQTQSLNPVKDYDDNW